MNSEDILRMQFRLIDTPKGKDESPIYRVTDYNAHIVPDVENIEGGVYVTHNFEPSKLKHIKKQCLVLRNTKFYAPNLETIDGFLVVQENCIFDAPKLKSIGDYLVVRHDTIFNCPSLEDVGYIDLHYIENDDLKIKLAKLRK